MAWSYIATARIERDWGVWSALVTLAHAGVQESFFIRFLAQPSDAAASAAGAALAASKNDDDAGRELASAISTGVKPPLSFEGVGAAAQRFRATYQGASRMQATLMAYWMIERITAGDFTDAQVRSAFGLTAQQYTAMKARMQTLHDHWLVIQSAQGE